MSSSNYGTYADSFGIPEPFYYPSTYTSTSTSASTSTSTHTTSTQEVPKYTEQVYDCSEPYGLPFQQATAATPLARPRRRRILDENRVSYYVEDGGHNGPFYMEDGTANYNIPQPTSSTTQNNSSTYNQYSQPQSQSHSSSQSQSFSQTQYSQYQQQPQQSQHTQYTQYNPPSYPQSQSSSSSQSNTYYYPQSYQGYPPCPQGYKPKKTRSSRSDELFY